MAFEWHTLAASNLLADSLVFRVPENFPPLPAAQRGFKITPAGFALGKTLFYDPALSADGSTACGNCHQASAAFANLGSALSTGVNKCKGTRNAPPLFNLAWQSNFMWDGRIAHLQQVPTNAITNPCEMATSMADVLHTLNQSAAYRQQFIQAFGNSGITSANVLSALQQFTMMLVSANSKYDKIKRQEPGFAFTPAEQAGYALFVKTCSTCHNEPLFTDQSYRNNGLDENSKDIGRDSVTHNRADAGKFRVPSLRNIEITGPYMHDGRFYSLKEVLRHYSTGMKNHANLDPAFKHTDTPNGITLSPSEQQQIIMFLKTLTDVDFINDRRFNNH
ncbi:cytochrome c peroxidase [Mucilaginibacter koreensis]